MTDKGKKKNVDRTEAVIRLATGGATDTGPCLTDSYLAGYLDGSLLEVEQQHVEEHLASCDGCRRLVAECLPREPESAGEDRDHQPGPRLSLWAWAAAAVVLITAWIVHDLLSGGGGDPDAGVSRIMELAYLGEISRAGALVLQNTSLPAEFAFPGPVERPENNTRSPGRHWALIALTPGQDVLFPADHPIFHWRFRHDGIEVAEVEIQVSPVTGEAPRVIPVPPGVAVAMRVYTRIEKGYLDHGRPVDAALMKVKKAALLLGLGEFEMARAACKKAGTVLSGVGLEAEFALVNTLASIALTRLGNMKEARRAGECADNIFAARKVDRRDVLCSTLGPAARLVLAASGEGPPVKDRETIVFLDTIDSESLPRPRTEESFTYIWSLHFREKGVSREKPDTSNVQPFRLSNAGIVARFHQKSGEAEAALAGLPDETVRTTLASLLHANLLENRCYHLDALILLANLPARDPDVRTRILALKRFLHGEQ